MKVLAAGVCLALCAASAAQPPGISTHTLANGMKLIVQEDHDIPNVAMYLFYRVGSRNERPGITGISHFFEHMMFNGSKKYGPKQFDIQMEKAGGHNNAYTSYDLTVYQDWFPATALPLMFDMEADRIRNLTFDPKMVESERGVVASERQTAVDNSNAGLLDEQLYAAAFTAHPYGWPVVGWASDIEAWTMNDLQQWFRMGYAPNNCTVVIVGDVTPFEVLKLARAHFEPIPSQKPPPPVRTVEPPQRGERRVTVRKPAQLPIQMVGYHVEPTSHADFLPLEMLATLLTEGRSSRLYRRLVDREQAAINVNADLQMSLDPGLLVLTVRPRAGTDTAAVEKVLFEEIETLRTTEVSPDELRKAKNQLLTALFRDMKTISGRANLLGRYDIYRGGYERVFTAEQDIERVTTADILRVARQYVHPNNRTVATLVPETKQ